MLEEFEVQKLLDDKELNLLQQNLARSKRKLPPIMKMQECKLQQQQQMRLRPGLLRRLCRRGGPGAGAGASASTSETQIKDAL